MAATVHVVARGAYWRSGSREYLRALSIDGKSWNPGDGAALLDPDATAALAAVRGGGADWSLSAAVVYRFTGRGRWTIAGSDYTPEPGELLAVCELTADELTELDRSGMPRAVYTRLTRAGVAPSGPGLVGAVTDPVPSRLRVSMRGRHGAARGGGMAAAAPASVPAPAASAPAAPAPAPVTRPNGSLYYPRLMDHGETDVALVRRLHGEGVPVLLYGPPGTGKTALLEAALGTFRMVPGTSDTEAADFLGAPVPEPGGSYRWVDGPLLDCARLGVPLIVDEIALVDPRAMAVVYEALDGRGTVTVTSWPTRGTQAVAPGFCVHGACNPDAPGADMSEALLSRMTFQMEYGTDYGLAERLGAPAELVAAARNLDKQRAEGEVTWSPQMRELLAFVKVARLVDERTAARNLAAAAPVMDRPVVCDVLSRGLGWQVAPLRLGEGS